MKNKTNDMLKTLRIIQLFCYIVSISFSLTSLEFNDKQCSLILSIIAIGILDIGFILEFIIRRIKKKNEKGTYK